ncbi:MAG TPA: copper resistance CopC family protein [Stellaceae bacterium]|nr:copper resistance CopC family protein [Stellaceae bacterium]
MSANLLARLGLACALIVAAVPAARAHAFLDHSDPAVGSTLHAPPKQVRIWFTEALEPPFSSMTVTDASGRSVGQDKAKVDPKNPALLEIGLHPLPPGTYRVNWRVVSVDTHPTEGNFTFTVKP